MLAKPRQNKSYIKTAFVLIWIILGLVSLGKQLYFSGSGGQDLPSLYLKPSFESSVLGMNTVSTSDAKPMLRSFSPTGDFAVKVPILMYHHIRDSVLPTENSAYFYSVKPQKLEQQLAFLKENNYQVLSLGDLYESLESRSPLPPKSVVITFDDGYRDFYTNAFPIVKKFNFRVVSFFVAGYTRMGDYMNWQMLHELHKSGLVDIESHSISHPLLTRLNNADQRREIFESRKILEDNLGKKVYYFAYPYGDYNQEVVNIVKEAGYRLAFSAFAGTTLHSSRELILPRILISGFDTLETFKTKLLTS